MSRESTWAHSNIGAMINLRRCQTRLEAIDLLIDKTSHDVVWFEKHGPKNLHDLSRRRLNWLNNERRRETEIK